MRATAPNEEVDDAKLLKRQKELTAKLQTRKIEFLPLAKYLCQVKGVKDVCDISPFAPFGQPKAKVVNAWEVMKSVTLGIEVGSVIKNANEEPHQFRFELEPEDSAEKQVYTCKFDPNLPWCKFLDSPQPREPFVNPYSGEVMPADLNKACVYNIVCRHMWSNVAINVAGRLNFYHKGINELQQSEAQDNLFAAAGGVKGAFISIGSTKKEGHDIEVVPMPALGFSCVNEFFTASMALINKQNIMNGIIQIPYDVCVAANLPVFRGAPDPGEAWLADAMEALTVKDGHVKKVLSEQEQLAARADFTNKFKTKWEQETAGKPRITCFYAIPVNHLLAWPLHSEDYANERGFRSEQFRYIPPADRGVGEEPIVLYFLIGDVFFEQMVGEFARSWLNKVDMRPLKDMAFEFLPQLDRTRYPELSPETKQVQGVMMLRSYVTYLAPPNLSAATISKLAPTLAPGFPSSHDWSLDEVALQMVIDNQLETREREGVGKSKNKK